MKHLINAAAAPAAMKNLRAALAENECVGLIAEHAAYLRDKGGIQCVAIGTDFDGIEGNLEIADSAGDGIAGGGAEEERVHRIGGGAGVLQKCAAGHGGRNAVDGANFSCA